MYTLILALALATGVASATTFQVTSFEATSNSLNMTMQVSAGDLFGNFHPGDIASVPSWPSLPGQKIQVLEWWDGLAQVTLGGQVYQGLDGGWTQITGVLPDHLESGVVSFPVVWSMDVYFSSSLLSPPLFEIKGSGSGTGVLDQRAQIFTYVSGAASASVSQVPEPGSLWLVVFGVIILAVARYRGVEAGS